MTKIICPYKSSGNKCVHRWNSRTHIKNSYCQYSSPKKCRLYNEWLIDKELHERALNSLREDSTEGDEI